VTPTQTEPEPFDASAAHLAQVRRYRALLAPGTPLREGLTRILNGRTGALIVLGSTPEVQDVSSGGFVIDVEFTPTALRELAKMDGGIVLSADHERILSAGVHFVPDGSTRTVETGTRHRTADRVAQMTGVPVVTVSKSMNTIAFFLGGHRHDVQTSEQILGQADQALAALGRYRKRLDEETRRLSGLEISDSVTHDDLVRVLQPLEMVRRLDTELRGYVAALGIDGRLMQLQLRESTRGVDDLARLLELDYQPADEPEVLRVSALTKLATDELLQPESVLTALGFDEPDQSTAISPRGYRLLAQASRRVPPFVANRLIQHFGSLQGLMAARTTDLLEIEGVGRRRAYEVREGLARLSELSWGH